jgi:hypothetical protein
MARRPRAIGRLIIQWPRRRNDLEMMIMADVERRAGGAGT